MARVVLVHGIGRQQSGEHQLLKDWLPALQDGLSRSGTGQSVTEADVSVAFYGDLFLPQGQLLAAHDPFYTWTDISDGWESEMLSAWWAAAAANEPQVAAPDADGMLAGAPQFVQSALLALTQSRFLAGLAERAMVFDIKQVRRYLTDPTLRATARQRVVSLVDADTRVVVGHSLGSVVAYEALCSLPRHSVRAFVTLGSPLGIPNLVFDRLDPTPIDGIGRWPGPPLLRWTNIADRRDLVSLVKDLRPCFSADIFNYLVPNGSHVHDATHYLGKPQVGVAVADGLG